MILEFEFSHLTIDFLAYYRTVSDAYLQAPTLQNQRLVDAAALLLARQFSQDAAENGV